MTHESQAATEWPIVGNAPTLADKVYAIVRERILAGQLPPLTAVREEQIAELTGVSRTPVREALSRLATEGFLERVARKGFRVPALSLEDLVDTHTVLQALEVLAGQLAFPRIQPSDLDELEELNARFSRAVAVSDVTAAVELNDVFHERLASLSGNAALCRILEDLRSQVRRLEVLDFDRVLLERSSDGRASKMHDKWVKQHAALLRALRQDKPERALELLRENRSLVFRAKVDRATTRQA